MYTVDTLVVSYSHISVTLRINCNITLTHIILHSKTQVTKWSHKQNTVSLVCKNFGALLCLHEYKLGFVILVRQNKTLSANGDGYFFYFYSIPRVTIEKIIMITRGPLPQPLSMHKWFKSDWISVCSMDLSDEAPETWIWLIGVTTGRCVISSLWAQKSHLVSHPPTTEALNETTQTVWIYRSNTTLHHAPEWQARAAMMTRCWKHVRNKISCVNFFKAILQIQRCRTAIWGDFFVITVTYLMHQLGVIWWMHRCSNHTVLEIIWV